MMLLYEEGMSRFDVQLFESIGQVDIGKGLGGVLQVVEVVVGVLNGADYLKVSDHCHCIFILVKI